MITPPPPSSEIQITTDQAVSLALPTTPEIRGIMPGSSPIAPNKAHALSGALQGHERGDRSAERLPAVSRRATAEAEGKGCSTRAWRGAPDSRQSRWQTRGQGLCSAGWRSGGICFRRRTYMFSRDS